MGIKLLLLIYKYNIENERKILSKIFKIGHLF